MGSIGVAGILPEIRPAVETVLIEVKICAAALRNTISSCAREASAERNQHHDEAQDSDQPLPQQFFEPGW